MLDLLRSIIHASNDVVTTLVHHTKLSRPERSKLLDPRRSGIEIRDGFQPDRGLLVILSHNVVVFRFHFEPPSRLGSTPHSRSVRVCLRVDANLFVGADQGDEYFPGA